MTPKILLSVKNLSKTFSTDFWKKPFRAVDDVTFEVEKGSVMGIVGPNGAGKTTALKMILGIIKPTSGSVSLMGESPSNIASRRLIGYLPESAYYYDYLNARELLYFYGGIFSQTRKELSSRVEYLLDLVGLSAKADLKLKGFSKGMLQRVGIAQALINDPQLVIFDEPMSGLDPIGRKEVRDIILRLKEEGKTILFSSHILHDVETLCDSVVMIFRGKVVTQGSLETLLSKKLHSMEVQVRHVQALNLSTVMSSHCQIKKNGTMVDISLKKPDLVFELIQEIKDGAGELISVVQHRDSLEELFMSYRTPQKEEKK